MARWVVGLTGAAAQNKKGWITRLSLHAKLDEQGASTTTLMSPTKSDST